MKTAALVAAAMLIAAIGWLAHAHWPRSDDNPVVLTADQQLDVACRSVKGEAMGDLSQVTDRLRRSEDASFERGQFMGRMWAAFELCFPRDLDHPDDTPLLLLRHIDDRTPPERFELLQKVIEDGWAKSKVGTPWRGEVPKS